MKKEGGGRGGGKEREKQLLAIAVEICQCQIKTRSETAPVTYCMCDFNPKILPLNKTGRAHSPRIHFILQIKMYMIFIIVLCWDIDHYIVHKHM